MKCGDTGGHFVIGLAEEKGASDEDIGAVSVTERGGSVVNTAVYFDIHREIAAGDFAAQRGNFGEHIVHEGLATEAGLDGHDEDHDGEFEEGEGSFGGCVRLENDPGLGAQTTNGVEQRRHFLLIVHAGRFEMDGDKIGAGVYELRSVDIRAINHEMDVERELCAAAEGADDGDADSEVGDEMSVHDIDVDVVSAGALGAGDFIAEASEIGGKDRRSNKGFHHDSIIAKCRLK